VQRRLREDDTRTEKASRPKRLDQMIEELRAGDENMGMEHRPTR
jgi:hypothetical protein